MLTVSLCVFYVVSVSVNKELQKLWSVSTKVSGPTDEAYPGYLGKWLLNKCHRVIFLTTSIIKCPIIVFDVKFSKKI